ncbi:MAG: Gfo/Idh/MocA family oxidoreductase [Armatimonadota bacterium]
MNIGFLGCGSYSQGLASVAKSSTTLNPLACFDVIPESAKSFGEQFGLHVCGSLDELLGQKDIQGIVIATPNNQHRSCAEAAAKAGKHVFVDKPIANTMEDGIAIVETCKQAGVTLAIGHNGRRICGHRKMKELIDLGDIGVPITVEANFSHAGGLGLTPSHWRYFKEECPGLPLMQLGVHFADTVQYLFGDITEVSSFMTHIATPAENDDVTVQILRFKSGLLGYLGSNYATPSVYYVNAYGTGGNLYCQGGGPVLYRNAQTDDRVDVPLTGVDTQLEELEEWAHCAQTGQTPEVDGIAGLKALAVVLASIRSHEERRPVMVSEILPVCV